MLYLIIYMMYQNKVIIGLFGWGGFWLMDLDLRVQIQILCLKSIDLKSKF